MTIEYKDSKRIVGLSSESLLTSSDYTSSNFTTVGSTVAITNNSVVFTNSPTNSDNRVYKSITALAESDVWSIDFKVNQSSGGTYDCFFLFLSATNGIPYATGNNIIKIQTQGTGYMRWVLTKRVSGTNTSSNASNNSYSYNTDYYGTLSSDGTNITLKIWTSSARSGSASVTLTVAVSGVGTMNYIQHGTRNSGDSSTWSGTVSEVALSRTLAKPTNVQDNSLFVEKDTARRYWFSEATAPTYETDFSSSTGWSQTGTQQSVNTSTGVIDWNGAASTSVHALSYDLGAVVEDNWILRFKWVIENHTLGSNPGGWVSIGLSDSDDTVGGSANQDSVSLGSYVGGSTNSIRFHHGNDGSMRQNFTNFSTTNEEATWYVQIVKTGTSVTIGLYPDSTYGTATESKTETISGTGFQYVVVKSRSDNTNGGSVYNGTIDDMKFYNGVTSTTPATWTWDIQGIRGVFGGGETSTYVNTMDYITMATLGNATDFGNLTASRYNLSSVSSNTRGVFSGGRASSGSNTNIMDYITIATLGDATDFGDLTLARRIFAGVSSNTRGVFAGGYTSSDVNTMDYITIATLGNAIDFGDLTSARRGAANVSSDVRGIFGGGYTGSNVNTIDYITIATPSNAIDFGNLTVSRNSASGVSSDVRGVFAGGQTSTFDATMDYVTIATLGNATDFGDMTVARMYYGAVSSNIRGIFGGGHTGSITNVIDYITIATTGNATDFGDLSESRKALAGVDDRLK